MSKSNNDFLLFLGAPLLLTILVLTSCSSGSDDGGASLGGVSIPTKEIAITSSNAEQVASESSEATDRTNDASDVVEDTNNSTSPGTSATTARKASNLARSLAKRSNRSGGGFSISASKTVQTAAAIPAPTAIPA